MRGVDYKDMTIGLLRMGLCIGFCIFVWKACLPSGSLFSKKCVFAEDVVREYRHVNKANGITEKEAGLIAQYEFVQRDVKNYFLKILNKIKSPDENTWLVTFQSYADGPERGQALDVCVDKQTGEITCWNKRPLIVKQSEAEGFGPIGVRRIEAE